MATQSIKYEMYLEPEPEVLQYSKEHLGEDDGTKERTLQELKELLASNITSYAYRNEDAFLLRFLRARNFSVNSAYHALERYYKFKKNHPEYYTKVSFDRIVYITKLNLSYIQPFLEQNGRRMLICRIAQWDPEEVTPDELFKSSLFLLELCCLEPRTQILGGICIFDIGGIKIKHARHLSPRIVAHSIEVSMHSYPMRIHAMHIVNESPVFKSAFALFRPFLPKEIRDRFYFHRKDMSTLHKHIDPEYLPQRYGGVHPDYDSEEWLTYVQNNEKVSAELTNLGYIVK